MIKPTISLQDLRRRIYTKAKAEETWKFWGLYVHVYKMETLRSAYSIARKNNGAAGLDGVTFEDIEKEGIEKYLLEIQEELITETYRPTRNRKHEIPKVDGKGGVRTLSIPTIRDRVVQGALKLILEPIFEADFQEGSYGYRTGKRPHEAISAVSTAIKKNHIKVIDLDLKSYFDRVRHDILFTKVAKRVEDSKILCLLKMIVKSSGKRGVPQGGVISPLLSNIYLNEVDKMLERAKQVTSEGSYDHVSYARFADDIVVLVDSYQNRWEWLEKALYKRLKEELQKIDVEINNDKTKIVNLESNEAFSFLGFNFKQIRTFSGKKRPHCTPKIEARNKLLSELKDIFRCHRSQPTSRVIDKINPILRGWVNYFRIGNSTESLSYVKNWVDKKVRRHLMRSCKRKGFGWKRWSSDDIRNTLKLYNDYGVRRAI